LGGNKKRMRKKVSDGGGIEVFQLFFWKLEVFGIPKKIKIK